MRHWDRPVSAMALHCRMRELKGLKAPFGLLARLRRGIDFEAIDDQPVDVVFLLLLPDAPNDPQLNALACAARALRGPDVLGRVRGAANRDVLYRALADSGGAQT